MLLLCIAVISLAAGAAVCFGCGAFATLVWLWLLPVSFLGVFLGLLAVCFAILMVMCKLVDQNVPQEDDNKFYRIVADLIVESAFIVLRIHVKKTGLEKVPTDGRFMLICNHVNNSDPIILLNCFRKSQLAFISKRENSTMFVIGPMMHKIQCQLINRENDREALKTILRCIRILKEDKASIAVFPEGGIKIEGKLSPFRPGVFKIATKTQVPIVVCTITNTHKVLGNFRRLKPTDIDLHLLTVIEPEEYKGVTTVELADRIYNIMAQDLGPEYVPEENT